METINKLTDKYFVLKIDDVLRFGNSKEIEQFNELSTKIALRRKEEGKGANTYLVLNLEDEIDLKDFEKTLSEIITSKYTCRGDRSDVECEPLIYPEVKDVSIGLVNAILKRKGTHRFTYRPKVTVLGLKSEAWMNISEQNRKI